MPAVIANAGENLPLPPLYERYPIFAGSGQKAANSFPVRQHI